jgi:hypothetical protein
MVWKQRSKNKLVGTCGSSSGFTLVELVFIVFLVGVISAFAYTHLDAAIDEGRYIECEGQLEAIRRAKSLYVVDHLGTSITDLYNSPPEREVFDSYFVTPLSTTDANGNWVPPHCPRVGLNANGDPEAPYRDPYNLYAVSSCPFCEANKPAGVRQATIQP